MNAVEVFQFPATGDQIRTVVIDGEPWFVAADACRVLGIDVTIAMRRLDDDEFRQVDATLFSAQGPARNVVNEPGLYSLILGSRKPDAKRFKRWVTHEVLPAIRKTGRYEMAELDELERARRYVRALEANAQLQSELAIAAPKAEAFDSFISADGSYSMNAIAKMLRRETGHGRTKLFARLPDAGVLMADNRPYEKYARHFVVVARTIQRSAGPEVKSTPRVLPSGVDFIRRKLGLPAQSALIPLP